MNQLQLFTGRRIAVDTAHTLAYPMVPLASHSEKKPSARVEGSSRCVVHFPEIAWSLDMKRDARTGKLPSTVVVDVLAALLHNFHSIGMPEDGAIPFSRRSLISMMRWSPNPASKPSGRLYNQLREALDHLKHTDITWSGDNTPDPLYGENGRAVLSISLVTSYRLAEEPRGRRARDRRLPEPVSWVQLDPFFVRLLKAPQGTVPFDLDRMMSLPSGVSRVLFRTLMWYKSRGMNEVPLRELFPRVGSTTDKILPAKAREMLGKSHQAMVDAGILRALPEFDVLEGQGLTGEREHVLVYDFAPDAILSSEDEQLVRTARMYGVSQAMAVELLAYREKLREVLWAVGEGIVSPRYPAGYIVEATRNDWAVRPQSVLPVPKRPRDETRESELSRRYSAYLKRQRESFLAQPDAVSNISGIRTEVMRRLHVGLKTHIPDWMVSQEVEREVTKRLHAPTYEEFAQAPEAWESGTRKILAA